MQQGRRESPSIWGLVVNFPDLSPVAGTELYQGDCRKVMAELPDSSVDAIVTDPPYEIGFRGRRWDSSGIAFDGEVWAQALRVLKPGGHILAFGATRTYHHLAVAVEQAGFEIRDCIAWIRADGMPKSRDIGYGVANPPKRAPARTPDDIDTNLTDDETRFCDWMRDHSGISELDAKKLRVTRFLTGQVEVTNAAARHLPPRLARSAMVPTAAVWLKMKAVLPVEPPAWVEELVKAEGDGEQREFLETMHGGPGRDSVPGVTTDEPWSGWGTGLRPSFEPIIAARKPISEPTIVENVLEYGTGGINIGACRIGDEVRDFGRRLPKKPCVTTGDFTKEMPPRTCVGRWPANAIVDETVAEQLGESAKFFYCGKAPQRERPSYTNAYGKTIKHSTVKPLSLMRYLVRLVTPPGGTVLDPFAGSGATLEAAQLEGFSSIGIELGEDHIPLILQRLDRSARSLLYQQVAQLSRDRHVD